MAKQIKIFYLHKFNIQNKDFSPGLFIQVLSYLFQQTLFPSLCHTFLTLQLVGQLFSKSRNYWSHVSIFLPPQNPPLPQTCPLLRSGSSFFFFFFFNNFSTLGLFIVKHVQILTWICFSEYHSYFYHKNTNFCPLTFANISNK